MEGELEKEIENLEKRNKELSSTVSKLKQENEDALVKEVVFALTQVG
jgi:cell division protein FtsB